MNIRFFLATSTVAGALALSAPAAAITVITVDGNLADWGVTSTSWTPNAGIEYTIEDQTGSGAFRLNPGWGGQAYDAEALYATILGDRLYIALATGHDPRTLNKPGSNSYGAGDFAIDFGKDGSYEVGININHALTKSASGFTFEDTFVEGGVYKNAAWNLGLWNAAGAYAPANPDTAHPTHLKSGTKIGDATLAYTTTGATGFGAAPGDKHFFYEMSLEVSLLRQGGWDGNSAFNIHWTENCANDSIIVDPPGNVPEPGSLALLGLGLAGLCALRRRRS